jgi:hypothetical protein
MSNDETEKLGVPQSLTTLNGTAESTVVLDDLAARIKAEIDASFDTNNEPFRNHLGASVIGDECTRRIYYHWNWFKSENNTAREERIFLRGHMIEEEIRTILIARGVQFLDSTEATGEQTRVSTINGHFGGSVDGIFIWPAVGIHTPMLLECKSSKHGAAFDVVDKKHLSIGKPQHWAQICTYCKLLGIGHVCYIIKNKNTEAITVKIIEAWERTGAEMIEKARYIIGTENPPQRISNKPEHFICKQCLYNAICHGIELPNESNCRNCTACQPVENATFYCSNFNAIIPKEALIKGCQLHTWKRY